MVVLSGGLPLCESLCIRNRSTSIEHLGKHLWLTVVLLSDGDVVFQPRKVGTLWPCSRPSEGHVLIYIHKEEQLDDVWGPTIPRITTS